MPANDESPNRRPGPIGFHAESKVTTQRHGPGSNVGGMGEAAGPVRQTPTRSRELRVSSPAVWAIVGLFVAALGVLLLQPIVGVVGIVILTGSFFARQANRTESRLRDEAQREG